MCGIWGYLKYAADSESGSADNAVEQKCAANLKHRGPDESNVYNLVAGNIVINMTFHRLAIVDVQNGHQPFVFQDGNRRVMLVANGEIYNYKRLISKYNLSTASDCEVILQIYLLIGIDNTVRELDGEFAFVLIDIPDVSTISEGDIRVFMIRDRFGIRPLFVGRDESQKTVYFSSELKGIPNSVGNGTNQPNSIRAAHVEPRKITMFSATENIFRLTCVHEYYNLEQTEVKYDVENEFLYKQIRDSLVESVKDRMYSERPLGCLLSGGLDSSLIAGIASRILRGKNEKLNTFSIGMTEHSPDVIYARMVAKHIGSNHTEVIIAENEWIDALPKIIYQIETYDTTTIRASTGQYLLAKWISENTNIKVLLNGDGSDELTSGYLYFFNSPGAQEAHLENIRLLKNIHYYDVLRVDRGISAHGLEARVPFLSHHFVDTYLSISAELRNPIKNKRIEKYLLRKSFESEDIIPGEVLWRKKEAFSDGVSVKEKSWYQIIEDSISEDEIGTYEFSGCIVPQTKESRHFRRIFDSCYPERDNILETNEYWLPRWSDVVINPSARILSVYE